LESNNQKLGEKPCLQSKVVGVVVIKKVIGAIELVAMRFELVGVNCILIGRYIFTKYKTKRLINKSLNKDIISYNRQKYSCPAHRIRGINLSANLDI